MKIAFLYSKILKSVIIAGLILSAAVISADNNEVYPVISPQPVVVGEGGQLRLLSRAGYPEIIKFPSIPGLKWSNNPPMTSQETNMDTHESVFKTIYQFTITREGTYTIPGLKVRIGHLIKETEPVKFQAFRRKLIDSTGKKIAIDDLLYISAVLMTGKDEVYVGEEIPISIRMYSVRGLMVSPSSWPQIDMENIVMKDYSAVNPQSGYFLPVEKKNVKVKGQTYSVLVFKAALRPIAPGTLSGKVSIPCVIKIPKAGRSRSRDPFDDVFSGSFFGSRYDNIQYKLIADIGPLTVKSLPPVPADTDFLGLVGVWDVRYSLSSEELKAGEPVTLTVTVKGKGALDTLRAPELSLDGFRIYPPEIKKFPSLPGNVENAEIRYAIIPKSTGTVKMNMALSTFSPENGEYDISRFSRDFSVGRGEAGMSGVVEDAAVSVNTGGTESGEKSRNGILFLKKTPSGTVKIPLRNNKLILIIFVFLLGPVVLIASELYSYNRQRLTDNPQLKRKNSARNRKNIVLKRLQNVADEDELHSIIQNDVTPLVNDLCGYPPGTSTDELAEKVEDAELAECLKAGSSVSYMPGAKVQFDSDRLRKKLYEAIKKISVIILLLWGSANFAADTPSADTASDGPGDPVAAYIDGKPGKAAEIYRGRFNPKKPDPAWLYNLGNCAVQEGDLPKALVYYERARRLAPGDSDIIENLNFVRRKLVQPEIGNSANPIESLENFRDSFRPDSWLLAIAVTWTLVWLSLAARRIFSVRKWISATVLSAIACLLCIIAYISQKHSTYDPANAIVVKSGVPVYMLPSDKAESAGFHLRPGDEVRIEETRHGWDRLRDEHSEGWVRSGAVERMWPYSND